MKETYEAEKCLYIVMEQVRGGQLFDHIRNYDLDEKEIAIIMN
jgi:serine/threonine protein kinase